jgi:hypothetical protein
VEEFVNPVLFSPLRLKTESDLLQLGTWNDSTFRDKSILSDDDER